MPEQDSSAPPTQASTATPEKNALDKAGDFVKYLTALATGALVFSADLLKKDFTLTSAGHYCLFAAWVFLALAAVGGLVALARIPMMLAENIFDLEDSHLMPALRAQQIFLSIGILALGCALALALRAKPTHPESEQASAVSLVPRPPFGVTFSAVHNVGGQQYQHTFMLNEQTGEIWEMVCRPDKSVEFRKVHVEGK